MVNCVCYFTTIKKCQANDAEKKWYSSSEERAVMRYGFSESSITCFEKKMRLKQIGDEGMYYNQNNRKVTEQTSARNKT